MSKEALTTIVDKAQTRAGQLSKQTMKGIEMELDNVLCLQMKKLEKKAAFMREFWQSFEFEK